MPKGGGDDPIDEVQNEVILAVAQELGKLTKELGDLRSEVEQQSQDIAKVWLALGTIAGLEELGVGLAQAVEILGPLKDLVPPVVSNDLESEEGRAAAMEDIREALGLVVRDKEGRVRLVPVERLPVDEQPVAFIGQRDRK